MKPKVIENVEKLSIDDEESIPTEILDAVKEIDKLMDTGLQDETDQTKSKKRQRNKDYTRI